MNTPSTRCQRPGCNRPLRSPESVTRGYSEACAAIVRAEAVAKAAARFTDAQVERARDLLVRKGLTETSRPGVYKARSSRDENVSYLVTNDGCACPAGQHDRICYHRVAAALADAWKAVA